MSHTALPQINLYDPALLEVHDPWSLRNIVCATVGVMVVMGVWGTLASQQVAALNTEKASLETQVKSAQTNTQQLAAKLAEQKPDPVLEQKLNDTKQLLEGRGVVLQTLDQGFKQEALTPGQVLTGMARAVPSGLWLTGFSLDMDSRQLEIRGRTLDPAQIANYANSLGKESAFAGRTFAALEVLNSSQLKPAAAEAPAAPGGQPNATARPATAPAPVQTAMPVFHAFRLSSVAADKPKGGKEGL